MAKGSCKMLLLVWKIEASSKLLQPVLHGRKKGVYCRSKLRRKRQPTAQAARTVMHSLHSQKKKFMVTIFKKFNQQL